jgi:glycosyltransferase involved in cell wall biosynthesis
LNTSKPKYKVSVITCSLGDFEGLSRTLISLGGLIGNEIESILVLSKYSSSEIARLKSISHSRDCKIIEQEPEGIYSAMNKGLSLAESELCIFLNGGDEICDPRAFRDFAFGLTSHEWAYAPIYITSGQKDSHRKYEFKPYSRLKHRLSIKFVPHPGTIYKTEILKLMGGFNTSFSVAADQELAMRFAQRSHPRIGDLPFAIFYSGGTSTRRQNEITSDFKLMSRQVFGNFFGMGFLDSLIWGMVRYARKLSEKVNSLK